jgi:hypothetical protein
MPTTPLSFIQKNFNYYSVSLYSELYNPANAPNTDYSRSLGYITCYSEKVPVGYIKFYDRELIPPNQIFGPPNYEIVLNFHISRFNDMMTLLLYEKPLVITMDPTTLKGSVTANSSEPIGEQEGV